MPEIPRGHRFEVVPDWVCEILSPSSASKDRQVKMPIYAHYGVRHAWLVDPSERTLETFELRDENWAKFGSFKDDEQVSAAPFADISIALTDLWC